MLINCKSSGWNVCLLAAGKPPQCYLLAARTFPDGRKKMALSLPLGFY